MAVEAPIGGEWPIHEMAGDASTAAADIQEGRARGDQPFVIEQRDEPAAHLVEQVSVLRAADQFLEAARRRGHELHR